MRREKKDQILAVLPEKIRGILLNHGLDFEKIQEIRLREEQPLAVKKEGKEELFTHRVTKEELRETMEYVSNYSLYAYENELRQGFLTIEGGHRVGISGKIISEKEQIRNFQNRPKGMDVVTWCTQNNLTKANYYYRLRRVRQICLDQMQDTETTAFVELPAPAPDPKKTDTPKESGTCISAGTLPMIRIKNTRGLSAEIFSGTSPEMLCHFIKAFPHAE